MSRGGRGGRGGGRGGRGGLGLAGGADINMGSVTREDMQALASKNTGTLYPTFALPFLKSTNEQEQRICQHTRELSTIMRNSPYRLTESQKVETDLVSYSDKYRPPPANNTTSLDPKALGLEKEMFPEKIWSAYFEPKKVVKAKKVAKKKKNVDDVGDDGGSAAGGSDAESGSEHASDADGADLSGMEEEEEDMDGDYAGNYFDNGEDRDEGGDGDDGGGGDGEY